MSLQTLQVSTLRDMPAERDHYHDQASVVLDKIVGSDNPIEILADFLTTLAFGHADDVDPIDLLCVSAEDWGCDTDEVDYEDLY